MKKVISAGFVLSSFFLSAQSFAFDVVCMDPTVLGSAPIRLSVDETTWKEVVVHPGTEKSITLPCKFDEKTNDLLCSVSSGDPTQGGGCANPYSIHSFRMDAFAKMTYKYVSSGYAYFDINYTCKAFAK